MLTQTIINNLYLRRQHYTIYVYAETLYNLCLRNLCLRRQHYTICVYVENITQFIFTQTTLHNLCVRRTLHNLCLRRQHFTINVYADNILQFVFTQTTLHNLCLRRQHYTTYVYADNLLLPPPSPTFKPTILFTPSPPTTLQSNLPLQ